MFNKGNPMNSRLAVNLKLSQRELKCLRTGLIELQAGKPFESLTKEVKDIINHFLVTT